MPIRVEENRWLTQQLFEAKEQLRLYMLAETDRRRAQDAEMRDERCRLAAEREEAMAEAVERSARIEQLQHQLGQLQVALNRVRESSKGGLLEQVAQLQQKVRELGARRTLNQRRHCEANFDKQRAKVATAELQKTKARTNMLFGSETLDLADDHPRLAEHAARLECEVRRTLGLPF